MKKLFFYAALFAAGFAVTSCSSDKDEVATNSGQELFAEGNGYIALNINLPTTAATATRAANENDNGGTNVAYDDGDASEYTVKDVTLIVFDASTQAPKAFYNLGTGDDMFGSSAKVDPTNDNVTDASSKIIQLVGNSVVAGDLMLVILNKNDITFAWVDDDSNSSTPDVFQVNGTTVANFAAFQAITLTASALKTGAGTLESPYVEAAAAPMKKNGFFMTNAPLADIQGSTTSSTASATVSTLVPITTVYKTYAEAEAGAADQIYVERGMAKVTVAQGSEGTVANSKIGSTALKYNLTAWSIDNANSTSYLVRSTDGYDGENGFRTLVSSKTGALYRYIGNTPITYPTTPTYPYRTYFAKSTNYTGGATLLKFDNDAKFSTNFSTPQYCFENTFNVANQIVSKTTLVQLKVTLNPNGESAKDLYTVGGNKTTIYDQTGLVGAIQAATFNYLSANSGIVGSPGASFSSSDIQVNTTLLAGLVAGTVTESSFHGALSVSDAKKAYVSSTLRTGDTGDFTDAAEEAILGYIGGIAKYAGGVSYYHIRIKHFGDNLTPWNDGEGTAPSGTTIATIYPGANDAAKANNYLGRYGVLRNNWYHLTVNSIRYLGDPTPNTVSWPNTPDDELDSYITFQINILSWAKRTQNANL